jgi:hypothetical protein
MPYYSYTNGKETVDILQGMNEVHEYIVDGIKWNRVYYSPQMSIDSQLDPFDNKAFIDKTGKSKDSIGSILDRSKELSAQRAEKRDGTDTLRENYLKKWKSERKGNRVHPSEIKRNVQIVAE